MQYPGDYTCKTLTKKTVPMRFLKTVIQLLVAGAFAVTEAVLYFGELPIARRWHRKHS